MFEDLKAPERVQFFDGQALRAEDLSASAHYLEDKARQDRRFLYGYGAVDLGAEQSFIARLDPEDRSSLILGPGYGFDGQGRDLRLADPLRIKIDEVWLESDQPALLHLVLKVTERGQDHWSSPDDPSRQGFRRIREETTAALVADFDPQGPGLSVAKILTHRDEDGGGSPVILELSQDHLPRLRPSLALTEAQKKELQKTIRALTKRLALLNSLSWSSVTDLRSTLLSILVTASSSGFHCRDWSNMGAILGLLFQDFQRDALGDSPASANQSALHRLQGFTKELEAGVESHAHALAILQELAATLSQFLAEDDPEEHFEESSESAEPRFNELEETISAEEDLGDRAVIPETVMIQGQLYHLVDELVLLDEESEKEHGLSLNDAEGAESATKTYRYPDGRARSAQGRIFRSGSLEWSFIGLEARGDVLVACRADVGDGPCEALLAIGDNEASPWVTAQTEDASRWRNGIKLVSDAPIEDGRLRCRLSPETGSELRIFGLWIYQAQGAS